MTKPYKILILTTFLIAIFLFGKWVNDIRPRYEWQGHSYFFPYEDLGKNIDCQEVSTLGQVNFGRVEKQDWKKYDCHNKFLSFSPYFSKPTSTLSCYKTIQEIGYICYKRTKVRVYD